MLAEEYVRTHAPRQSVAESPAAVVCLIDQSPGCMRLAPLRHGLTMRIDR